MTRNNMADLKFPSWLSTKWSAVNADILLIADSQDNNKSKAITKANLLSDITTDLSNTVDLTSLQEIPWQKIFENLNNKTAFYLKDSAGSVRRHINHNTDFHLTESGVADNRFVVKAGGNVWIGTWSPTWLLEVWTNADIWSTTRLRIIWFNDTTPLQTRWDWWGVWSWIGRTVANVMYMQAWNYWWHDMAMKWNYNFENNISIDWKRVDWARTSYTPTVGATSWSASSVTVNLAKYKQVGKMVFITGRISFAKNTLSWSVYITLPVTDNSYLWSVTGFIGDNGGSSLNQGRTQFENAGRMYFENWFWTSYIAASDLWWWTVWVRRHGVYEAA